MQEQLVNRDKILLPSLYIKRVLIKNLIKALDKGDAFQFIRNKCPHINDAKIDVCILNGPHYDNRINSGYGFLFVYKS